jgi:hypothetical protein
MLKTITSTANTVGSLEYKGLWNAATNTPTLVSSVGTQGDYYVVSVAGTTNLDGVTTWDEGDWAIFNGSVWQLFQDGQDGVFATLTVSNYAAFADNAKATFGTGAGDLQIYHDGSSSRIANSTGNLIISDTDGDIFIQAKAGENSLKANNDGSVELYFDGVQKFNTTATGIDISGTATMDGLTVSKTFGSIVRLESTGTGPGAGVVIGDLQFYGNDASAPGAGIKASITATTVAALGDDTSTPAQAKLDILMESDYSSHTGHGLSILSNAANAYTSLYIGTDDTIDSAYIQSAGKNTSFTSKKLLLNPNGGNVGIGTDSPGSKVTISDPGTGIGLINAASGNFNIGLLAGTGSPNAYIFQRANAPLLFGTNNVERARLTGDGKLLVGTTSTTLYDATSGGGVMLDPDGPTTIARSANVALYINRTTSDGRILQFNQNGTIVGSIGTVDGDLLVGTGDTGLRFHDGNNRIYPINTSSGSEVDATIDLGDPLAQDRGT